MKVVCEESNRNYLPWMVEKCEKIIFASYNLLASCSEEQEKDFAHTALYNALKVMFALNNKEDVGTALIQYLIDKSYDEFERWKPLIIESDRDKKYEFSDVGEIDEGILSCITEDGWYKSYIPEKVIRAKQRCYGNAEWLNQIDKDYEQVVQGEIPWRMFYEMHRNDRDEYIKLCSFNDFLRMISGEEKNGQDEI